MQIKDIIALIEVARQTPPFFPWPGYRIQDIPFAVYDEENVAYIGHPAPPETRPQELVAATSVNINGIETATIPADMCKDAQTALTMIYHEGFHVHQHLHFSPMLSDMFTAMAHYPDLDLEYRTLCALEADVLRKDQWSAQEKLGVLGHLTRLRRDILSQHPSLLAYERYLERNEGTASYVEQHFLLNEYDTQPTIGEVGHGWQRFYQIGAAFCWLLDEVSDNWQDRIEDGDSPGDLVMEWESQDSPLDSLDCDAVKAHEAIALHELQDSIQPLLATLKPPNIMRIRYGGISPIYRAFDPSSLISLGDGRVLHRTSFQLLLPDGGSVRVKDAACVDHVDAQELLLPLVDVEQDGDTLRADTEKVQIEINSVSEVRAKVYALKNHSNQALLA